ncbi:MAG TPA: respiratory nitrate reductase subunit gamma, partial [Candidatus Bathyarchaeia archaeon]|nr:respiratory nitrate reductase subunit gamma [Candidatus Bathyarchaeia archaeon]
MKPTFAFAEWPYVALAVFCLGVVWQSFRLSKGITLVKAKLPKEWAVFGRNGLWRISVALLFLGHIAGLAFPRKILLWDGSAIRLYALEGLALAVSVVAVAGWVVLIWKHVERSDRSVASEVAEAIFLEVTFVALLSGLLMAVLYRWGSFWGVLTLRPYVVSLLRGAPAPGFALQMPFLVRLHVFSSFTAVALVPFSRLAPFLALVLHAFIKLTSKGT